MPADEVDAVTDAEALAALERFVVENDDLLELEECIGRFNIFDALGIARTEIRHSNFLAWLLDPAESHGQGSLFLSALLMDLLKTAREREYQCPLSPIQLDGADLKGVEVRREWRNIDLLIRCDDPKFVVAIENKIDSGEHSNQLDRYEDAVGQAFPDTPLVLAYLSVDDEEPSSERWVPYFYADIHRVLRRVRQTHAKAIGEDVLSFLDHYLNLIGSRFMDDPKIDELCERIYRNHRQALDLLFERCGSPEAGLANRLADLVTERPDRWLLCRRTSRLVQFVPREWEAILPPLGKLSKFDSRHWLFLEFRINPRKGTCGLIRVVGATIESTLRRKVIERLVQDPNEFGMRSHFKSVEKVSGNRTSLGRSAIASWGQGDQPDEEQVITNAAKKLDQVMERLAGVPDALRPIIEQWQEERDAGP